MLQKGDKVVMHTCGEAEHYNGKIWTCKTDQFNSASGTPVVFLEGFSGYFACEYLQIVHLEEAGSETIAELTAKIEELTNENESLKKPVHIDDWMYELKVNEKNEIPVLVKVNGINHTLGITEKDARSFNHLFKMHKLKF